MKTTSLENSWNEIEGKAISIQEEAHSFFYDSMIAEINDSLASILAACDSEGKGAVPKIKQYIQRINQSLNYIRECQAGFSGSAQFNITASLRNIIQVLKHHYKDIKVIPLISDIKAPIKGSQSTFERFFLYSFGYLFSVSQKKSEIMIELRQRGQEAVITLLKDEYVLDEKVKQKILSLKERSGLEAIVNLTSKGRGVEMIIQLPIQFKMICFTERSNRD